jgi:hypothetical protein
MTRIPRVAGFGGAALALALALSAGEPGAPAQPPGKAPPAAKADTDGWKELFDGKSLDGWKAADFGDGGKVSVQDGAAVMERGDPMSGLTYRRGDFPTLDYEVRFEGKRVAGDDFFCTATFPVGDSFCSLVVGGWGGSLVGLSSVNYEDASMNETTTTKEFQNGRWYPVRIRVTKSHIRAWIDGEKVVDLESEDKKLSIRRECAPSKPFGFATWKTSGAVRNIRVHVLTDAEKKAEGAAKDGEKR